MERLLKTFEFTLNLMWEFDLLTTDELMRIQIRIGEMRAEEREKIKGGK